MTDVSRAAGVSLSTVSHLLNGTRRVGRETRIKILNAAETLGYCDDRVLRARDARRLIGVVVPSAGSPYFGEMLVGLEAEASRAGATVILTMSDEDPTKEFVAVRTLLDLGVDAVLITPSVGWRSRTRPLLLSSSAAVVLVDRLDDGTFDQIGSENVTSTEQFVAHLIALGHTRIGMITGIAGLSTSREREVGFRRAHERHGLTVDRTLIRSGGSTVRGGMAASTELLRSPSRPTAIFCANNNMTVGLVAVITRDRIRVPQDLAFVSFDDLDWGSFLSPTVSVVAQPFHAIGARAIQLATRRIEDPDREPLTIRLPCSIEHRESCGCSRLSAEPHGQPSRTRTGQARTHAKDRRGDT